MLKIAVTGGIACGKSLVASFLVEQGVTVCDADDLAHDAMQAGGPVFREIVEAFGQGIIDEQGAIDRPLLGARVFADPDQLATLNRIVHPSVIRAWRLWLAEQEQAERDGTLAPVRGAAQAVAAVVVPLLFEVDERDNWDAVLCVASSEPTQLARLRRRGLSQADGERRIASQMPGRAKMALADYVVVNDGTKDMLREQTGRVLRRILER